MRNQPHKNGPNEQIRRFHPATHSNIFQVKNDQEIPFTELKTSTSFYKQTEPEKICKRRFWDQNEDLLLKKLVEIYGPSDWKLIATKIESRNAKQCSERWYNHLAPNITHASFTVDEDNFILDFYLKNGSKWKKLEQMMPHRTTLSLKNRFNSALKKRIINNLVTKKDEDDAVLGLCTLMSELEETDIIMK